MSKNPNDPAKCSCPPESCMGWSFGFDPGDKCQRSYKGINTMSSDYLAVRRIGVLINKKKNPLLTMMGAFCIGFGGVGLFTAPPDSHALWYIFHAIVLILGVSAFIYRVLQIRRINRELDECYERLNLTNPQGSTIK